MKGRKIVVGEIAYRWSSTSEGDWIDVVVRAEQRGGATMITRFVNTILVTPYAVRVAIERAIADGWTPTERGPVRRFRIEEPIDDKPTGMLKYPKLGADEKALLDRIADGEPEAASVYADWLQERGDVRGEWIANGQAPPGDAESWLGPVAQITRHRTWTRGVFTGAELWRAQPGVVDKVIGHPAWATVTRLDAYQNFLSSNDILRILEQDVMWSLREVAMHLQTARAFAASTIDLRRAKRVFLDTGSTYLSLDELAAIEHRCPVLEHFVLAVDVANADAFLSTTRAKVVRFNSVPAFWSQWLSKGPRVTGNVRELQLGSSWGRFDVPGATIALTPGPGGHWTELTVTWSGPVWDFHRQQVLDALAQFPEMTSVTVGPGPDENWERDVLRVVRRVT